MDNFMGWRIWFNTARKQWCADRFGSTLCSTDPYTLKDMIALRAKDEDARAQARRELLREEFRAGLDS